MSSSTRDVCVTAVVVTFQSQDQVGAALESLRPSFDAGFLRVVVVDNGSTDETVSIVRRDHPWASLMESGGNLGYGRGCNVGLADTRSKYVLFMNPDVTISQESLLVLVRFLDEHPQAGLAAPAIFEGESLQSAGALPSPWRIVARAAGSHARGLRQRPIEPGAAAFRTDWLCGAVLLARTQSVKDLGGFDPGIFLYFEETDLCKRLLDRGLEIWAVGESVAHHSGNASAKQMGDVLDGGCLAEHYYRSRYHFLVKHHGRAQAAATEVAELGLLALRAPLAWFRGRDGGLSRRLRLPVMKLPVFPDAPAPS